MSISRRVLAGTAAAACVAVLTACEPDQVGTAVTVGGDRLSVSELQDQVIEVVETKNEAIESYELGVQPLDPSGDLTELQRRELNRWISARVYGSLADEYGITVSEAQIDGFLDEFGTQFPDGDLTPFIAEQEFTDESLREAVRVELIRQQLAQEAGGDEQADQLVAEAAGALDIEVNPRYGTWSEAGFAPDSGSVSVPFEGTPG